MELPPIATSKAVLASLGAAIAAIAVAGAVGASTVRPSSASPAKPKAAAVGTSTTKPAGSPTAKTTTSKTTTTVASTKAGGKATPAVDACGLVTPAEASAAFGGDAGVPHLVLASCLFDDGTHKLIISLTRDHARSQFDVAKGTSSQAIPGLGDEAYFRDGRLGVIKASRMMLITLAPASGSTASPGLLAVARAAVGRL